MNSMTIIVFVAVAIVAVSSMPQFATHGVIPVLQRDEARDDHGQFSLRYITGDGTTVTEQGKLTPNSDGSDLVLVKEGSYTYTSPEGKTVTIRYVADERGFQPVGDAIPVAPVV
ncbi:endocuticle structural glycoprotein ABD-5-like [Ischnura elegans]|uniref:endocuticle structural glycoprotein ABD-5-like n=1 Tax=Ischnura elegans TaxID=197161 RepID=UPI001ED8938D|nr:endocuticle structural glycoprotein ABD-5-like [Ischnura elegans]